MEISITNSSVSSDHWLRFSPSTSGQRGLPKGMSLEEVEFFRPRNGSYQDTVRAPGIITSHSCDFTKFQILQKKNQPVDRFPLLVAPLIKRSQFPDAGTAGHAVAGRVARYFHIPNEPPLDHDHHFADFWFMQPVAALELLSSVRLASMTDEWQMRLQRSLDRFFSWEDRKKPLEPTP